MRARIGAQVSNETVALDLCHDDFSSQTADRCRN
jgi:hypothetical protein